MRRSSAIPLFLVWIFGILGACMRMIELTEYKPWSNLIAPNPTTWVLYGSAAFILLAAADLCYKPFLRTEGPGAWHAFRMRPKLPREGGIHGRAGIGFLDVNVTAAFLLAGAGAVGLWNQSRAYTKSLLAIAAYVMCFVACGAVIAAARQVACDKRSARFPILLMAPSFCFLLRLIANYQGFAKQPVVQIYLWQMLAQITAVLALYFMVSLSMGRGNAARVATMSLWAIFLTLISLGDWSIGGIGAITLLWDGFILLYLSAQAWLLLREEPEPWQYPTKEELSEENSDE